ncbi:lens fiber membrane intrinsic protein-like [Lissotriton helveticus]
MMSALKLSSLVLIIISLIVILISLASDYWMSGPGTFFGLWRICVQGICGTLGSAADIDATRAFIIISFLLLVLSAVAQILEIWINNVSMGMNKQKLVTILNFCAACSAIIAMGIFTGSTSSSGATLSYSWSFALGWVSAGLILLAGVVALVSFKKEAQ